jgi:hypothetical protein
MKKLLLLALITCQFSLASQTSFYVKPTASGSHNGLSWQDAFTQLNVALSTAQAGDEIWVAQGTYYPASDADRSKSFTPPSGIKLYGGFTGSETDINQRDWQANPTILSGDIGVSGDSTDNTYNVVYMLQPDSTTILDGFVVAYGQADNLTMSAHNRDRFVCGGGLYMESGDWDAFATIQHCRFYKNNVHSQGGGVMLNGTLTGRMAPKFIDCIFESNYAGDFGGGGMSRYGGSGIERGEELKGCTFVKNSTNKRGGALYYADTKGINTIGIKSCNFTQNYAKVAGGGIFLSLGKQETGGVYIHHSNFTENSSDGTSALILFTNGLEFEGDFELDSCVFESHIGIGSGNNRSVIYTDILSTSGSEISIKNTSMSQNNRSLLSITWGNANLKGWNNLFKNNIIDETLRFSSLSSNSFINCTFKDNHARRIIRESFTPSDNIRSLTFENCIFEHNTLEEYFFITNPKSVKVTNASFLFNTFQTPNLIPFMSPDNVDSLILYNNLFTDSLYKYSFIYTFTDPKYVYLSHNFFSKFSCTGLPVNTHCGPGNLFDFDPQFIDPANHDYRLRPCSPLLNAGSNLAAAGILTDLAGTPRIQEGTVDIGAYESPSFTLASVPIIKPACVGASNGSISVEPVFGCEPYTYNWLPAAGNGPELNGLPPGNYLLTITDGSGRQILDTLSVSSAPTPELSPFSTDVQCSNGLGGSIASGIAGGTPPYHFEWLPTAADTSYRSALPPGNYALTVTDVHGCQDSATTSIALQGIISLMVDGQVIPCHGETGWLSATPVTGAAPYQWLWQGWPGTDSLAQPLGPGQYSVTVTDAFGCTASNTFPFLNDPSLLTASIDSDPQTNLNMPNGAAELTSVGGGSPAFPPLAPYQYNWSNGGMEAFIGGLTAGTYTVTITDKNGCTLALEVLVDLMVGTQDPSAQALLIYPNPATDWLRVVLPAQIGACTLELLDESGRVLRSLQLPNGGGMGQLDLQGLARGSYWVRVVEGELVVFGSFLKI